MEIGVCWGEALFHAPMVIAGPTRGEEPSMVIPTQAQKASFVMGAPSARDAKKKKREGDGTRGQDNTWRAIAPQRAAERAKSCPPPVCS